MLGQGQGIGQNRSLCNGRSYRSYEVMVCFILFYTYGVTVKVYVGSVVFATAVPTEAMGLEYTLYSSKFTFRIGGKHGSRCASRLGLCTMCWFTAYRFNLDTVGFNYGVKVKV